MSAAKDGCRRAALFALFYLFMSQYALAQVTLLVERGASTYQQAAYGFRSAIGASITINEVSIDESGGLPQDLSQEIVTHPPRLIVAIGTRAAKESIAHFPSLPTLYCLALLPIHAEPQSINIGGVFLNIGLSRQIENARKIVPNLRNVGVVYDPVTSASVVRELQTLLVGKSHVVARTAQTPQGAVREIELLFSSALGPGDAFLLLWDSVAANPANFKLLVELSLKNKIPLIAPARPFVEAGALLSTGADYEAAGRQVGAMARQVISGTATPRNFGSVSPSGSVLTVNAGFADQLGLKIPADLQAEILGHPRVRISP